MKFVNFAKDYKRLFRFDGFGQIFNDSWMLSYRKRDGLTLTLAENTTLLIPSAILEANLKEGMEFFADDARFQKYRKDYEAFLPVLPQFFKDHMQGRDTMDLETITKFFELGGQIFDYFYRTEFFYLDEVYKIQDSNPVIKENLKIHYALKERGRMEHINDCFFGENSFLYVLNRILEKQFGVRAKDLLNYGVEEYKALFAGVKVSDESLANRRIARIISSDKEKVSYLFGEEAKKEILEFREKTGDVIPYGAMSLKGVPANKGIARGKVKIIISNPETIDSIQQEFAKMEKGDILVAETTSPEFMPACAKAAAIVADQGGLLSHAAVVSREFGIPSIVATKYATKILKDGDLIEVDGGKGTITVIERI